MKIPEEIPEWLKIANSESYLNTRDMKTLFNCSSGTVNTLGIPMCQVHSKITAYSNKMRNLWKVPDVIKFINNANKDVKQWILL